METPNTRSRRKRDMESSSQEESGGVGWTHDPTLRQAILSNPTNEYIPPPTPTQKPRSITTRLTRASDPPRKRPCRKSRSGPGLDTPPAPASSNPQLGQLLNEAMGVLQLHATPKTPTPESSSGSGSTSASGARRRLSSGSNGRRSSLGPRLREQNPNHASTSASVAHNIFSKEPKTASANGKSALYTSARSAPAPSRSAPASTKQTLLSVSPIKPHTIPSSSYKKDTLPRAHSPIKPGPARRIGLTSSRELAKPSPSNHGRTAFKAPFLPNPPIRSSPRRPAVQSPRPTAPEAEPHPPSDRTDTDMHSDKGNGEEEDGDKSFDSFDGMFAEGGEDIEELLRAVEGRDGCS